MCKALCFAAFLLWALLFTQYLKNICYIILFLNEIWDLHPTLQIVIWDSIIHSFLKFVRNHSLNFLVRNLMIRQSLIIFCGCPVYCAILCLVSSWIPLKFLMFLIYIQGLEYSFYFWFESHVNKFFLPAKKVNKESRTLLTFTPSFEPKAMISKSQNK